MRQVSPNRISAADSRIITAHMLPWTEAMSSIPPDSILSKDDLNELVGKEYFGDYRGNILGALIRYSLANGLLRKLGPEHFVRVGRSRESSVELAQIMSLVGMVIEEISPGVFLGYEDLEFEEGRRERHYRVFARRVGESFQWMMISRAVICPVGADGVVERTAAHDSLIARRIEQVLLL